MSPRRPPVTDREMIAIVRQLGYLHQEMVRLRLHFITWVLEMALLQIREEYPALGGEIDPLRDGFRF